MYVIDSFSIGCEDPFDETSGSINDVLPVLSSGDPREGAKGTSVSLNIHQAAVTLFSASVNRTNLSRDDSRSLLDDQRMCSIPSAQRSSGQQSSGQRSSGFRLSSQRPSTQRQRPTTGSVYSGLSRLSTGGPSTEAQLLKAMISDLWIEWVSGGALSVMKIVLRDFLAESSSPLLGQSMGESSIPVCSSGWSSRNQGVSQDVYLLKWEASGRSVTSFIPSRGHKSHKHLKLDDAQPTHLPNLGPNKVFVAEKHKTNHTQHNNNKIYLYDRVSLTVSTHKTRDAVF